MNKPRSPIEAMIDQACGYDPAKHSTDEAHVTAMLAVIDAAERWYVFHRETEAELTPSESELAAAVKRWLELAGEHSAT
jgi:hypothetical protein